MSDAAQTLKRIAPKSRNRQHRLSSGPSLVSHLSCWTMVMRSVRLIQSFASRFESFFLRVFPPRLPNHSFFRPCGAVFCMPRLFHPSRPSASSGNANIPFMFRQMLCKCRLQYRYHLRIFVIVYEIVFHLPDSSAHDVQQKRNITNHTYLEGSLALLLCRFLRGESSGFGCHTTRPSEPCRTASTSRSHLRDDSPETIQDTFDDRTIAGTEM